MNRSSFRLQKRSLLFVCATFLVACAQHVATPASSPGSRTGSAPRSTNADEIGRAYLSALFTPGSLKDDTDRLRARFAELGQPSMFADLADGLSHELHGRPHEAAFGYTRALVHAQRATDPDTHLVAWFAARHLLGLRGAISDLYRQKESTIEGLIASPGNIGFRALAELEEWWASDALERATVKDEKFDEELRRRMGCVPNVRFAGPFGHGSAADETRAFGPEGPGPWPRVWAADEVRGTVPRELRTVRHHCQLASLEQTPEGVFYAETFVTTKSEIEAIVAIQGASHIWVDDTLVLARSNRIWGDWQRFGTSVVLAKGRHRITARVVSPIVSVRVLAADGTAANVTSDVNDAAPYSSVPPKKLPDPNPLEPFIRAKRANTPYEAALAAYASHVDSMDDVASFLMDPLTTDPAATPFALALAAEYVDGDPAFAEELQLRTAKRLHERAAALDGELWHSALFLIGEEVSHRGLESAVEPLRGLVEKFQEQPEILEHLARIYGRLGWRGERLSALRRVAKMFPDDVAGEKLLLEALDQDGSTAEADEVAARLRHKDPESEVTLVRAIARHDWKAAVAELGLIGERHPDKKEIAARLAEALSRSGDTKAAVAQLDRALAIHPRDAATRFRRADIAYAEGDHLALQKALGEALHVGANTDKLRKALDLLEGATDLEPYRIDGRAMIREFEAWEKAGNHMEGNAARVLDYAATWVHPDGSSEMLEHEIQRIQSQEAAQAESEIAPPTGLILKLRVLKPDGAILEPEQVSGKPTLTLPHLDVGDYIEIEHIAPEAGDGQKGLRYRGPHWFFREADKGYWRSEFVVVTPNTKKLTIETNGDVKAPAVRNLGAFTERRWRVDQSPPSVVEPDSPPIVEFLPTVRVGWGVNLGTTISRLIDMAADETPMDPRIEKKAQTIITGIEKGKTDEQAERLYRYVAEHIQDGKEADGRRVIFGGMGLRQSAFQYLLRAVGIPTNLVVSKSFLAPPSLGEMSEVDSYDALLLTFDTDKGTRFQMMRDKFAPFGFVPAEVRGQKAVVLTRGAPSTEVKAPFDLDHVEYRGEADVAKDGSAKLELTVTLSGTPAIIWRNALEQIPDARLFDVVEREVIAPTFDGAHVRDVKIEHKGLASVPLVVHIRVDAPAFGKQRDGTLVIHPPLAENLRRLTALPDRTTPLLRRGARRIETHLEATFPDSIKIPRTLPTLAAKHDGATIEVKDAVRGQTVIFDRWIDIPAGRVPPGEPYLKFKRFIEEASGALERDVVLGG